MKQQKKFTEKGITLIALIITIIVLLILAGVTIAAISGNESVLDKAQDAKSKTDISSAKEAAILKATEYIQDYYQGKFVNNDSSVTTYTTAGAYVAKQFETQTQSGNYYMKTDANSRDLKISLDAAQSNVIVEGTIEDDGTITWSEEVSSSGGGYTLVEPTGVTITNVTNKTTIKVGETLDLTASMEPEGTEGTIEWSCSLEGAVTFSESTGESTTVTAVTAGSATITAKVQGTEISSEGLTITIDPIPTGVTITNNSNKTTINQGGTLSLSASIQPTGVQGTIKWSCSPEGAVTFSSATGTSTTVTSVKSGSTTITATVDGTTVSSNVTIMINPTEAGLYYNNNTQICTWNELLNSGLRLDIDYTSSNYNTESSSLYYVLQSKGLLNSNIKLIIGSGITKIGNYALYMRRNLKQITIPNSVTSIGDYSFYYCDGLTSVTIPSNVTSIGNNAFYYCFELTSITIPSSVISIGNYAFVGDSKLTSVTIPNSVTTIGASAFMNCSGLTSISFPSSVTTIGQYAFCNCTGLTSITIPSNVTSIGSNAFDRCSGLTSITVNSNNTVYDSRNSCNAIIKKSDYSLIAGCKNTVIPTTVKRIYCGAFCGCTGLTSITIPSSVTIIDDNTFNWCDNLTSVTFQTTSGWKVASYGNPNNKTSISVTNTAANATNLTTTYLAYIWTR